MASKRRRNKVKFKWNRYLIILIVALVALITATIILSIPSEAKRNLNKWNEAITAYNTENSTSYSTITSENVFTEIDESSYKKEIKKVKSLAKSSGYTYFWYGSLTNGDYLEQLSAINTLAKDYEIDNVYLLYATYVTEAEADEETDTADYKKTVDSYEDILNADKDADVEDVDLTSYPALLVYKDSKLIFNSQGGSDEYSWSIYIQKAFSFEMVEKANEN